MHTADRPALIAFVWLGLLGSALGAALVWAQDDSANAKRELDQVTRQLNALDAWLSDARKRKKKWQHELERTDAGVASTRTRIRSIESDLAKTRVELSSLTTQQSRLETSRRKQAQLIADHLAAAHRLSSEDFFKALLNQQRPDQFQRMLRYHQTLSTARAETVADYERTLIDLADNVTRIKARERELAAQQRDLAKRRTELAQRKTERGSLLTRLSAEMEDRSEQRTRLRDDHDRLEALLRDLAKRAQSLDGADFGGSRGRLPWPISGPVSNSFGSNRAGGQLKWQGLFIRATAGADARAIHRGRVVFSDWLRGFGLLTIVDHGSGYMTLYGHSDVLYKSVGDWVEGGEPIATAGTSGGQSASGLYFEVRNQGRPRDPIVWLTRR